jgi:hypothetical protein
MIVKGEGRLSRLGYVLIPDCTSISYTTVCSHNNKAS